MNKVSKSLIKGAQEALEYVSGNKKSAQKHEISVPQDIDVKAVRLSLHLNRTKFAQRFGFSPRTIEKWEQGTRHPDRTAKAYLTVILRDSEAVENALYSNDSRHATQ